VTYDRDFFNSPWLKGDYLMRLLSLVILSDLDICRSPCWK